MTDVMSNVLSSGVGPADGISVLHLFAKTTSGPVDADRIRDACAKLVANDGQLIPVALLGHKADLALMALHADWVVLRRFQTEVVAAGVALVDSYVSVTEMSEYSIDVPENQRRLRLYPKLPPAEKPAWCFYPMSKRRNVGANWYSLSYEQRRDLMREHGMSGSKFAGRIAQLVTGSTGLDEFEWGVTLWGEHVDDLKSVVYTLRYDEGSAVYGEFGTFYVGVTASLDEVFELIGL